MNEPKSLFGRYPKLVVQLWYFHQVKKDVSVIDSFQSPSIVQWKVYFLLWHLST